MRVAIFVPHEAERLILVNFMLLDGLDQQFLILVQYVLHEFHLVFLQPDAVLAVREVRRQHVLHVLLVDELRVYLV